MTLTSHPLLVPLVIKEQSYTSTPPMGHTACTEPQCLYKGALYLTFYPYQLTIPIILFDARPKYSYRRVRLTNHVHLAPRLTHCGRVTQICVFNTVKLGSSASSRYCHPTRGNVSRGITPSSTTRVFGEYFLKISVHKNS